MCIVHKDLHFSKINFSNNCKEKDLTICVGKLESKSPKFILLSIYTGPMQDFNQF